MQKLDSAGGEGASKLVCVASGARVGLVWLRHCGGCALFDAAFKTRPRQSEN